MRTWFSYGARWTSPQKAAFSLAAMRAMEGDEGVVAGWFLQAQPGLAGGRLSVGYGVLEPANHAWVPPGFAAGLKASVLRTWGSPHDLPAGLTLLGPEVDLTLFHVNLSAGWLWRVGGELQSANGVFAWGLGFGF